MQAASVVIGSFIVDNAFLSAKGARPTVLSGGSIVHVEISSCMKPEPALLYQWKAAPSRIAKIPKIQKARVEIPSSAIIACHLLPGAGPGRTKLRLKFASPKQIRASSTPGRFGDIWDYQPKDIENEAMPVELRRAIEESVQHCIDFWGTEQDLKAFLRPLLDVVREHTRKRGRPTQAPAFQAKRQHQDTCSSTTRVSDVAKTCSQVVPQATFIARKYTVTRDATLERHDVLMKRMLKICIVKAGTVVTAQSEPKELYFKRRLLVNVGSQRGWMAIDHDTTNMSDSPNFAAAGCMPIRISNNNLLRNASGPVLVPLVAQSECGSSVNENVKSDKVEDSVSHHLNTFSFGNVCVKVEKDIEDSNRPSDPFSGADVYVDEHVEHQPKWSKLHQEIDAIEAERDSWVSNVSNRASAVSAPCCSSALSDGVASLCSVVSSVQAKRCFMSDALFKVQSGLMLQSSVALAPTIFQFAHQLVKGCQVIAGDGSAIELISKTPGVADRVVELRIGDAIASERYTPCHRVVVPAEEGGVRDKCAGELKEGDMVVCANGPPQQLTQVTWKDEDVVTYELAFRPDKAVATFMPPPEMILTHGAQLKNKKPVRRGGSKKKKFVQLENADDDDDNTQGYLTP